MKIDSAQEIRHMPSSSKKIYNYTISMTDGFD